VNSVGSKVDTRQAMPKELYKELGYYSEEDDEGNFFDELDFWHPGFFDLEDLNGNFNCLIYTALSNNVLFDGKRDRWLTQSEFRESKVGLLFTKDILESSAYLLAGQMQHGKAKSRLHGIGPDESYLPPIVPCWTLGETLQSRDISATLVRAALQHKPAYNSPTPDRYVYYIQDKDMSLAFPTAYFPRNQSNLVYGLANDVKNFDLEMGSAKEKCLGIVGDIEQRNASAAIRAPLTITQLIDEEKARLRVENAIENLTDPYKEITPRTIAQDLGLPDDENTRAAIRFHLRNYLKKDVLQSNSKGKNYRAENKEYQKFLAELKTKQRLMRKAISKRKNNQS
jgi:hypothetical protein